MRKVALLSMAALIATFAWAGSASAASTMYIVGSNLPGTNTYSIVVSYDAGSNFRGFATEVTSTGTYTGVFSDPATVGPFTTNLAGPTTPFNTTGVNGYWGFVGPAPDGAAATYTIGTVQITVGGGDTVGIFLGSLGGFVTSSFTTVAPTTIGAAITIVPEPTTAALLGLGIVGLVMAGRRSRA